LQTGTQRPADGLTRKRVVEARAFLRHLVEIWREAFEDWSAVTFNRIPPLLVGKNEKYVRLLGLLIRHRFVLRRMNSQSSSLAMIAPPAKPPLTSYLADATKHLPWRG
jgi:hypothetical protein